MLASQGLITRLPREPLTNITHVYLMLLMKVLCSDYRESYGPSGFAEIRIPVLPRWVKHFLQCGWTYHIWSQRDCAKMAQFKYGLWHLNTDSELSCWGALSTTQCSRITVQKQTRALFHLLCSAFSILSIKYLHLSVFAFSSRCYGNRRKSGVIHTLKWLTG